MAKKRKVRKFADGGDTAEDAFADYRARHPEYEEPEPGLEQVDKELVGLLPAGRVAKGVASAASKVAKKLATPSRATRMAEMGDRIVAKQRDKAMRQAERRTARRGYDPRNNEESVAKDWNNIFREKSTRAAERAGKRAEQGYDPYNAYKKGGGIESKGKTQGKTVKMARGGGIESKGKTRGRFV